VGHVRRLALDRFERLMAVVVQPRDRLQETQRIGMPRPSEELVDAGDFGDSSGA
jgi:hypothetical protein